MIVPTKVERVRSTVDTGPGLTEQAHSRECDMNYIIDRYQATGLITHAKRFEGRYDDVSVADFQEAMFLVKSAQSMFDALPANVRKRFANDPAEFISFVTDPRNSDEIDKLGLSVGLDGKDRSGADTSKVPKPVDPPADASSTSTV